MTQGAQAGKGRPDRRPTALAVADFFPWPPRSGGQLRTSIAVEALAEEADVDLFSFRDLRSPEAAAPEHVGLRRVATAGYPQIDRSGRWRIPWLLPGRPPVPMEVAMRAADAGPRSAFASFLATDAGERRPGQANGSGDPYDLVWFARPSVWEWLGRPRLGPTIVDLHDLESDKERRRAELMEPSGRGVRSRLRHEVARAQARLNARRWRGFELSVAAAVDRVLLASDEDARREQLPGATVLPNTYRRPVHPVGRAAPGSPPTVVFQGTFDYGPNVDGARWLVAQVAPRLRDRLPGARVRLVGTATPAVERLADPPHVVVTGRVPDIQPELAGADVAVVPLRYASGTRLKILESFAHRVPVASTTVGAEGLDVEDGVHLLIGDTPDDLAAACARLVEDRDLRSRLVGAAEALFLARYEARVAHEQIRGLLGSLGVAGR